MPQGVVRGVIVGYRRSRARQYNNQVLVKVFVPPKDVHSLIGSRVVARDPHGNVYRGRIVKVHSRSGSVVRVFFRPNIPGQMIGSVVEVLPRSGRRA